MNLIKKRNLKFYLKKQLKLFLINFKCELDVYIIKKNKLSVKANMMFIPVLKS